MKNIFLIIFLLFLQSDLFAQVNFISKNNKELNYLVTQTDTLGYSFYQTNNWGVLQYSPVGYVFGNNIYNDKAKIQVYNVSGPQQIFSVLVGFGIKRFNSADSSSNVKLRLYNMDKNGFAVGGSDTCPGSYFYSKKIPVYSIDTANLMRINVDSFAQSLGSFGVGIDFSGLHPKDTVVLSSTNKGVSIAPQTSWESSAQNMNYTILNSWGFESTPAIFPETSSSTGFKNINRKRLNILPGKNSILIISELQGNCQIMDMSGKLVRDFPFTVGENYILLEDNYKSMLLIVRITDKSGQFLGYKKLILDGKE
jgi:hypothetical protein